MALKDIIETIEIDAQNSIKQIEKERDETLFQIKKEGSVKFNLKRKELLDKTQAVGKKIIEKAFFNAYNKTNDEINQQKLRAINDVYLKVEKKLINLEKDEYFILMENLWSKINRKDNLEIFIADNKEKETKDFFLNKGIQTAGVINSKGGFIIKTKELEIDNTFEAIINNIRKEIEIEMINILFKP